MNSGQASHTNVLANYARRWLYPAQTCATCDAPLDTSEQVLADPILYCSRSRSAADHPLFKCFDKYCGRKFLALGAWKGHGFWCRTLTCAFPECQQTLNTYELRKHLEEAHLKSFYCAQCGLVFGYQTELDSHGIQAMHAAYVCQYPECGSQSARVSDLVRHQLVHKTTVPRHPCPHCRKDHLRQHIRNYHHINADDGEDSALHECPRDGCDKIGQNAFKAKKLQAIHLKKDHPSPFQCPERGCDRVGTKGWMRERDMVKHFAKFHSAQVDVPEFMTD